MPPVAKGGYSFGMGTFWVIASAFGFATLGLFGKLAYEAGFSRNEALFWRFAFALPVFALILVWTRSLPKRRGPFLRAIALGAIGIGSEATLYFVTLQKLGAALTVIFLYLYPAFVCLISHFFLSKRMSLAQWGCIFMSLAGCALTGGQGTVSLSVSGLVFGVMTGFWYAVYLLVGEKLIQNENPLTVSAGIAVGSFFSFSAMAAGEMFLTHQFLKTPKLGADWVALLGLAFLSTVLPFGTLYLGMKRIGVAQAALLSTLEVVFGLGFAYLFLGEKLTLLQGVGAGLILLSVLLIKLNRRN